MIESGSGQRFEKAATAMGLDIDVRRFTQGTRTAVEAAAAAGCELGQIVKSLVFLCDGEPFLALTSGAKRVDTAALGRVLGGSVKRADANTVRDATGYAIGGTPPFGHTRRLRTVVDATLLGTGMWTVGTDLASVLVARQQPPPHDHAAPGNPLHNAYECSDGRWVQLVMPQPDRFWARVCTMLGLHEWAEDERYDSIPKRQEHTQVLTRGIAERFRQHDFAYWREQLDAFGLIWAPVSTLPDLIDDPEYVDHLDDPALAPKVDELFLPWVLSKTKREAMLEAQAHGLGATAIYTMEDLSSDPHVRGRGYFQSLDHPAAGRLEYFGPPFTLHGTPVQLRPAPLLGEHTVEVLSGFGYSREQIVQLRQRNVV